MSLLDQQRRLRIRILHEKNGKQVFKAIIAHPMETGYRRNHRTGEIIPADYIEALEVSIDGKPCFEMTLGPFVAAHPYFSFVLAQAVVNGQTLQLAWTDNQQRQKAYEIIVRFGADGRFAYNSEEVS